MSIINFHQIGCLHCKRNEFVCPLSGLCISQSAVCDGYESDATCTDELYCNNCPAGHFVCNTCVEGFVLLYNFLYYHFLLF